MLSLVLMQGVSLGASLGAEVKPGLAWRIKMPSCHTVECIASMGNIDNNMIEISASGLLLICFASLESWVFVSLFC